MRLFNEKEKEILKLLDLSNGFKFQTLFSEKILNLKITIDSKSNRIDVRYKTKFFQPDKDELVDIDRKSNELFERIYLAVTLVKYFEKEGYISLYRSQTTEDKITIGDKSLGDCGVLNEINDETIKQLLFEYTDKYLIVTSEFNEFVKNGFISRDEKRQKDSIKLAWIGIWSAIGTSLISTVFSLITVCDKSVEKFNNDFNTKIINKKMLINHIDDLKEIHKITNAKLDSLQKEINKKEMPATNRVE
ncbi:MAG: hypothetical protein U0V72_09300 [Cytophagales bacterium]